MEIIFADEVVVIIRLVIDLQVQLPTDYIEQRAHKVAHSEYDQDHAEYSEDVAEHDPSHNVIVIS